MSDTESKAIEQRDESNMLQKMQLNALRVIGAVIAAGIPAAIWIAVLDHYSLRDLQLKITEFVISQKSQDARIARLERVQPAPESRATAGMMSDFTERLRNDNTTLRVPDWEKIRFTHSQDLPR